MKLTKYYLVMICCLMGFRAQTQTVFHSIDSLLARNFETVNMKDSAYYVSLLHLPAITKGKYVKTKADTLKLLKPFTDAFSGMIRELVDLAGNEEIEIKYESYESPNTNYYDTKFVGNMLVKIKLLINNTFTVTVPFMIAANNGLYTIEQPMMVMFTDQ